MGYMEARRAGAECKALTAWALLGSYYWNELVTYANGHYEAGSFDVRSGTPFGTELAHVLQQIATGEVPHHPALERAGWWHQDDRVLFREPGGNRNGAAPAYFSDLVAAA